MIINIQLINNIIVLIILIALSIDWVHGRIKEHQSKKLMNLNNECQSLDKTIKKICPAWHENTARCVRWTIYVDALNSKDGDDNGTQKNK